jgi:hypothetical protein
MSRYLVLLDLLLIVGFFLRAWRLEALANRWLRTPTTGLPFSSLSRPEHFAPGGEVHRRKAARFVNRGFIALCVYLGIRSLL